MWRIVLAHLFIIAAVCAQTNGSDWIFTQGGLSLKVGERGIGSLRGEDGTELIQADILTVEIGDELLDPGIPEAMALGEGVEFRYGIADAPGARLKYRIEFVALGGWPTIRRTLDMVPPEGQKVRVRLEADLAAEFQSGTLFAPRIDGVGLESRFGPAYWEWPLGPEPEHGFSPEQQLAIPLLSAAMPDSSLRITVIGDPLWGSGFLVNSTDRASVAATSRHEEPFTRTFWTVIQSGAAERAMDAWYATALADVPPGPDWLHDIAWQHYDYLSHGGTGWFEDLDALERVVAPVDRRKIVFALHGWYDMLGRYTFDEKTGRLDETWTAFPNAAAVKEQGFPTSEPVQMSKSEMHRRIRYAKDRGVRVALYFADGLTACEGAGRLVGDRVLYWGGWNGPDTVGKPYAQNPAHPDVYQWYLGYLNALLAEYGREIDALIWDETFMVRASTAAPETAPRRTCVAPAMMRLVRDLAKATTDYRDGLAFLVSDCIGATSDEVSRWTDVPPYAIMAHGCYQDSHSRPSVWPYGIFPNYRNVLWSCNWRAVTRFDWTEFGVEHYDTPLATSNGWLDDKGIARLSDDERNAVVELFEARKERAQRLHWLSGPAPQFQPAG
ncbi:MAG TPA: hypothetical protein PKY01_15260 [Candidatus Hydrogenedentes bacterium]|nr:hypothetical protein [Candidatus Hydrogenedentota bacterium]